MLDAGERTPYPAAPMRCPHCRLVIGVGRARADGDDGEHGARAHGSAAGVVANAARREQGDVLDPDVVTFALRTVATTVGCPLDRLRMLDYQVVAEQDSTLPSLAEVIATCGTWKKARREAAEPTAQPEAA
jgi:hypothetical protein